jgi:hypothetical protein
VDAPPLVDPSKVQALIAGGLGAFLSVLFQRSADKLTIITTLVTAEVTCYYLARPIWGVLHAKFDWFNDDWQGPVALSVGLLAIFIVGGIVRMAKDFWASPWKTIGDFAVSILGRFLPKKEG